MASYALRSLLSPLSPLSMAGHEKGDVDPRPVQCTTFASTVKRSSPLPLSSIQRDEPSS